MVQTQTYQQRSDHLTVDFMSQETALLFFDKKIWIFFILSVKIYNKSVILTHSGLETPYRNKDLGQLWLR